MGTHAKAFSDHSKAYRWGWLVTGVLASGITLGLAGALTIAATAPKLDVKDTSVLASRTSVSDAGRMLDPVPEAAKTTVGVVAAHIDIPDIGVSSDLESLAVDASGTLHPPTDFDKAGWYSGGVVPGQIGPAIIAGHLDSTTKPAVFEHLDAVKPGSRIVVTLSDGSTATFEATSSSLVPKATFPTNSVYGNVPTAQLRLITCDGQFDPATGHYVDNLVVFATAVTP